MLAILVLAIYGLLLQPVATATTTTAVALADDPNGLIEVLFKAARDQTPGWQVAVLVVVSVLVVFGLRKFSGWAAEKVSFLKPLKWFTTDLGGYTLAITSAVLEVCLGAVVAGHPVTGHIVWAGVKHAGLMALAFAGGKKTGLIKSKAEPAEPPSP